MRKMTKESKAELIKFYESVFQPATAKMLINGINNISGYHVFKNGSVLTFDKPMIETSFCAGYGFCGISNEIEEQTASKQVQNYREKDGFIAYNIDYNFGEYFEILKNSRVFASNCFYRNGGNSKNLVYLMGRYEYQNELDYNRTQNKLSDNVAFELDEDDKNLFKAELLNQVELFKARLETYWKKFGNTKLRTWTFLRD